MSRTYGWAPIGRTPLIERPAHGRRIRLIGAIALEGALALRQVEGYVDGEVFVSFLRDDLGPLLKPGDVVVLDGPSIHKVAGVAETLAERGARALYLPPYSPELNPIEMAWSWIKGLLRAAPPRQLARLRSRWGMLTAALCAVWVKHSGYHASP